MSEKSEISEISKSQKTKIERKQRRCQQIIQADTGIEISNDVTKFIGVCNAGLSTGLQAEELLQEATKHGILENVVMIPNKSYCFLKAADKMSSGNIFNALHGKTNLAQNGGILYLSYFKDIPASEEIDTDLPNGLILIKAFVTPEEEKLFLDVINDESMGKTDDSLKHRKVKHYGYEFLYDCNNVDVDNPLPFRIPKEFYCIAEKVKSFVHFLHSWKPEQLTVNVYEPGQGIPSHVDTHSAFTDAIISLSLESDVVMEFKNKTKKKSVLLPRRSILIMTGESRYGWTHGIVPRKFDIIPSMDFGLTVLRRERRTSLTFRQLRRGECRCKFSELCDTYQNNIKDVIEESVAGKLELENVHKVYDEIANHFSDTRQKPWPNVQNFIDSLPQGSVLLDIGCGNGKYLQVRNDILKIGCDRSWGLLKVCAKRRFNLFQCDCLELPVRTESIDGCISIAVIHHLATEDRRFQAIKEMLRVLRKGGKALIYVWAKDQEANNKKSNYLKQGKGEESGGINNDAADVESCLGLAKEVNLPIHTNRTQFQQQDIYVPWKLKSQTEKAEKKVFLRYYHVFQPNELEELCQRVENVRIEKSYYDQGNWCVIFEKL